MTGKVVVLITAPKGKGDDLAEFIVSRRLAACVNVVGGIRSFYWWKGELVRDDEDLLVVKTTRDVLPSLISEVKRVHPYTVPEIIALDVVEGNPDYLKWVEDEVKTSGSGEPGSGGGED